MSITGVGGSGQGAAPFSANPAAGLAHAGFYNECSLVNRHVFSLPIAPPSPPTAHAGVASLMAAEMSQVDAVIQERLRSDVAMINQISHYIIGAGGKRIRPMLVLLFSNAFGFHGS